MTSDSAGTSCASLRRSWNVLLERSLRRALSFLEFLSGDTGLR